MPEDSPAIVEAFFPDAEFRNLRHASWGDHRALLADGRVYATNGEDLATMVSLAALPMLAQGGAEPVCGVIGLAGGVEATALAAFGCPLPDVFDQRGEELRPLAAQLSAWVALEEVRLRTAPPTRRYDVLVQSMAAWHLSRPHRLFAVERLRVIAEQLQPGGVFALHVPLYFIQQSTHRRLLATVTAAFEHVAVLAADENPAVADLVVLAANQPIGIDPTRTRELLDATAARWLSRIGARSPDAFIERVVFAERAEIVAYCQGAQPYDRDHPMAPGEAPLGPASEPSADPDAQERFATEHDAYARQFAVFADEFARPESRWGRACRAAPTECSLFNSPPR